MTKREINLWAIHHGLNLSPEEVESAVESSSLDPEEGAEWLPFYKASLGYLSELAGLLSALLHRNGAGIGDEKLNEAKRLWLLHLYFGGIGPDNGSERGQMLKSRAEKDTEECFAALAGKRN